MIFESINPPMLQLINKKNKDEVIGKKVMDVLPELNRQPVFDIFKNVLQTGEIFSGKEVPVTIRKDGVLQTDYFNLSYTRILDASGAPSVLHMAFDVTDKVLARRKTEESEVKLRSILNSAPTAMGVFVGPDLIVENPNQLMIEVMAAGPDTEGKSLRKVLSGLVNEDQKFLGLVDAVRTTGQTFEAQEVPVFFKAEKKPGTSTSVLYPCVTIAARCTGFWM
jgi:PAS domain S-box-containing protein